MTKQPSEQHLADVLRMLMGRHCIPSDNDLAVRLEAFENGKFGPSISQPTLSRILNGSTRDPRSETVRRLGRFFGITESQMRGLDPIEGVAAPHASEPTTKLAAAETSPAAYVSRPPGEPGASECLALLSDFSRLSVAKRQAVTQLAHDLRNRDINSKTPLYTLEEVTRAVQAILFPQGVGEKGMHDQEVSQTMDEIAHLLRIQKAEFFSHKNQEQKHKTTKI